MKVLEESTDALDMYLHHLPDQLTGSAAYKIPAEETNKGKVVGVVTALGESPAAEEHEFT